MKKKSSGQKRPKITRTSYVSLPNELVNNIRELKLTSTQLSHCIKFVGILYRDSIEEFWDATIPTPKPQNYLTKTFDDKYYQWLNVLIENNIVNRSNYYSQSNHVCYDYVVNPKYESDLIKSLQSKSFNVLCKEKYSKPLLTVGYKDIIKDIDLNFITYRNWFIKDIDSLKIDYDLLYDVIETHLDNIKITDFMIDEEILPTSIRIKLGNGKVIFKNVKNVLASMNKGECLIKDKSYYQVVVPEQFLAKKKATMLIYYVNSIERLKNNCYNVKRNNTNNRLDTNLTNMASVLVDEICRQNKLVQIDLSNSQFSLLTSELDKHLDTTDFRLFKELAASGNLYNYIAKELGVKNVKNGKIMMFEIMFSSHRSNSEFKKKIKILFPSVIAWIDQYKKEHGDENFSVMLQLKESFLFIDKIYQRIKKAKLLCFSKHDSMIVRKDNLEQVVKIMQEEFAKNNLAYRLKVSSSDIEYFVYSSGNEVMTEQKSEEITMLQTSYTEFFKYAPPTNTLTPAQFQELTGRKYIESVSYKTIFNLSKNYNRNGFDNFRNDLQQFNWHGDRV